MKSISITKYVKHPTTSNFSDHVPKSGDDEKFHLREAFQDGSNII